MSTELREQEVFKYLESSQFLNIILYKSGK